MFSVFRRNKRVFTISIVMSLVTVVAALAIPFMTQKIFSHESELNSKNILTLLGILLFNYVVQIIFIFFKENFAVRFNRDNLGAFLEKLFHVRYDKMLKEGNSSLIDRLASLSNTIYLFLMTDLNTFIASILIIIGSLIFVFRENVLYGALMFIMLPVTYFGYKALNKELTKRSMTLSQVASRNFQDIRNIYENPDFLKQHESFDGFGRLVDGKIRDIYVAHADINKFAGSVSRALGFLNDFVQNGILILLSFQVATGKVQIASLVLFTLVMNIYFSAVYNLNGVNLNYTNLKALRTFYQTDILGNQEDREGLIPLQEPIQTISFSSPEVQLEDARFTYAVEDSFSTGDVVYVEGESGSGKSTLIRSLLRVRETKGISVNGKDLNGVSIEDMRARTAYVPQQASIITATLRENILVDTVKDSALDEKILSLPILEPILQTKTLDTDILKNGENLSGGEKQRVAIARALMKDADIYIFDEVTSNLDGESQEAFFESFIGNLKGKIVFIISHDEKVRRFANRTLKFETK
ncbi:MAG: ABC transporter ATP-binding protein [Tissierellia bacterium]|nr:ABC transporter ATP-binding protein [Tissierellia bacterium]